MNRAILSKPLCSLLDTTGRPVSPKPPAQFLSLCMALALLGIPALRAADAPPPAPEAPPPPAVSTNDLAQTAPAASSNPAAPPASPVPVEPAPAPAETTTNMPAPVLTVGLTGASPAEERDMTEEGPDSIRLNFRGVPLEMVLNYLSEAAGFIIVLDAQPRGRIDAWSNTPVTREEAVALLNSVLQKNGLAAIRKGRTLTIVNRDEAKIKAVPVKAGGDPDAIPDNDEIVTQILPVRYVEASQVLKDLTPLVSVQTAMTANESGNAIVITDTQSNIRRVAEIIKALDMSAEDITEVRVFHLKNSDPQEMADLLTNLFPEDNSRSGSSSSGGFRSFFGRGFPGGPPGGPGSGGSNTQNQRIRKRARVVAVPDHRTASIVVTSTKDLMFQIEEVVKALDEDAARRQTVKVFQLQNADPQETISVLEDIFQKSGTQRNRNSRNDTSLLQNRVEQQQNQLNRSSSSMNRNSSSRTSNRR